MPTVSLPTPSAEALAHSQQLKYRILKRIEASALRSISFYKYMQMALYEPQLGYYVAGTHKIGAQGDFTTAPEISSLFSQSLAHYYQQLLPTLAQPIILELGAGSGKMAADTLRYLAQHHTLPQHYWILEPSPSLRARQHATLLAQVPDLIDKIIWLDTLPTQPFKGIIVGNEVVDAMPVELVRFEQCEYRQVAVTAINDQFEYTTRPLPEHLKTALNSPALPQIQGYTTEYNPALTAWVQALSGCLDGGALLLIDYGYAQTEYYHPDRSQGTLLCYYQHRVHTNALMWPGLQDITASVNFTALTEAALQSGFNQASYTTQANFLFNTQLEQHFNQALAEHPETAYQLAQQVRLLTLPAEMGERFKVWIAEK